MTPNRSIARTHEFSTGMQARARRNEESLRNALYSLIAMLTALAVMLILGAMVVA